MDLSAKTLKILLDLAEQAPIRGKDALVVAVAMQEARTVLMQNEPVKEEKKDVA